MHHDSEEEKGRDSDVVHDVEGADHAERVAGREQDDRLVLAPGAGAKAGCPRLRQIA